MISQAIMATHEPKTASGQMIKKYILQYHENFMIDKQPYRFKKALEKACSKNIIRSVQTHRGYVSYLCMLYDLNIFYCINLQLEFGTSSGT